MDTRKKLSKLLDRYGVAVFLLLFVSACGWLVSAGNDAPGAHSAPPVSLRYGLVN